MIDEKFYAAGRALMARLDAPLTATVEVSPITHVEVVEQSEAPSPTTCGVDAWRDAVDVLPNHIADAEAARARVAALLGKTAS